MKDTHEYCLLSVKNDDIEVGLLVDENDQYYYGVLLPNETTWYNLNMVAMATTNSDYLRNLYRENIREIFKGDLIPELSKLLNAKTERDLFSKMNRECFYYDDSGLLALFNKIKLIHAKYRNVRIDRSVYGRYYFIDVNKTIRINPPDHDTNNELDIDFFQLPTELDLIHGEIIADMYGLYSEMDFSKDAHNDIVRVNYMYYHEADTVSYIGLFKHASSNLETDITPDDDLSSIDPLLIAKPFGNETNEIVYKVITKTLLKEAGKFRKDCYLSSFTIMSNRTKDKTNKMNYEEMKRRVANGPLGNFVALTDSLNYKFDINQKCESTE